MYHVAVHSLAERVLREIREQELLRAGDRVGIAVSGGIDSVALLRLLLELRNELGIVVSVVHFNHQLRGAESAADQEFVAELAREHGLEFYSASGDVAQLADEEHSGLEAAARQMRYGFFGELLGSEDESEDSSTSGAKAQNSESSDRSAESAAPPKGIPQGLKPEPVDEPIGTVEAVPFPVPTRLIADAVPFPRSTRLTAEAVPFPSSTRLTAEAVPFPNLPVPGASQRTPYEPAQASLLNKLATGHTLDDQAETVLMRLIRGTGMRGLGGIYPRILVEPDDGEGHGEIIRPLLPFRRSELQKYLSDLKQPWREDSTNVDSRFTRNRVRKLVMPLLEREFNPTVTERLVELAAIARDEEDYWENEISGWLGTVVQWSEPEWTRGLPGFAATQSLVQINPSQPDPDFLKRIEESESAVMNASLSRPWLLTEPKAVQRRVLKAIGEQAGIPLEFKHIEEILRFAEDEGPAGKELSLPLGWKIVREPEAIVFVTPDLRQSQPPADYEYPLPVPGRVVIPELGGVIEALRIAPGNWLPEYNSEQLLRADLLAERLTVRNWRAGDRFWPAHTKAPKKVKELLHEQHVDQPKRRLWPVAVSGDEIVWMRDFPVPARWRAEAGQEALLIRETLGAVDDDTI
jgi:tRNA(Ile)-lysidine synthase